MLSLYLKPVNDAPIACQIFAAALGIRPTPFAEFARRHAADFLGTSAWGMAQKERKHPLGLRDLPYA